MRWRTIGATTASFVFGLGMLTYGGATARADPPSGWGGGGKDYELSRDKDVKHGGKSSGSVKSKGDDPEGFGTLTQVFRAEKYQGKRLKMTAFVKSEDVDGWAGLWMRIDGKEKTGLAFDNMQQRAIQGTTDWQKYEIVLDVPEEAEEIYFGFLVSGKGKGWVDDIKFETVGDDVETTGPVLQPMDRDGEPAKNLPKAPKNLDFEE
jgi:hypothetical protein